MSERHIGGPSLAAGTPLSIVIVRVATWVISSGQHLLTYLLSRLVDLLLA